MARDKEAWLARVRRRRDRRGPDRPVALRPRGQGPPRQGGDLGVLRQGDRPEPVEFNFVETYQCGNEEANVGNIVITSSGYQVIAEGVFTYRVNDEGKIVALRAYWELDRATASARKI